MAQLIRVRTTLLGSFGGPGLSTNYFFPTVITGAVTADVTDVVARVRAYWFGMVSLLATSFTAQVQGSCDLLDAATGALVGSLSVANPAVVTGTAATGQGPTQTTLLARYNTNQVINGRRVQGRSFIGPVAGGVNLQGVPIASALTVVGTAGASLLTGSTSSVPVVWHRPHGAAAGVGVALSTVVCAPYFAVLRSRRD